jgi:anhydro-N-acetylmuramic acid kinase
MAEIRTALGLMSGTSLDGVDVALLRSDGERIAEFGPARTYPYREADRRLLRQASKDALKLMDRAARPGVLTEAEALVTLRHAEAVEAFLAEQRIPATAVDLVGFHGQTVLHDPERALTVQIGDGQALADRLRIAVAWDLRADDVAAGGQGAPLAPVFHRALADCAGLEAPVVFLNLGGVANITYVGAGGGLLAFDTGPGNGLLDDMMLERTGQPFDTDGRLAASGRASQPILQTLLEHPYFALTPPKSLDRNAFETEALSALSDADGAATLLSFSALAVKAAQRHLPETPRAWYVSGGGRHNGRLMQVLNKALADAPVLPLEALGFDGDATEAQAFAFVGIRAFDSKPLTFPKTTGVPKPLSGGRLSIPGTLG